MALQSLCSVPGCTEIVPRGACRRHSREREHGRGSRQSRGYDRGHDAARREAARLLPSPCLYCGRLVHTGTRWDLAHVVDGRPEFGLGPAHPVCNQRAKRR